ncbi:hypothetical protein HDE_13648 [Halotydeus destructor]|nr:hypothetical protein HDE_13648 [Halotydeus destructor]
MSREADSNKWSRNLSDETANESNRLRLINRQKQILENKRQRQQQIVATSTRDDSRPIKSASAQKSIERISLINTVDHGEPSGVVNPSLSLEDVQPRKSSPLLASASSGQEEHSVDLVLGQVSPIDSSSPDEPSSPLKANNLSKVSPSKSKGSESEP